MRLPVSPQAGITSASQMPIAVLNKISKSFGDRVLFQDASLNVYRGQRVGLVGANGSGKSTLMRILIGEIIAESGDASIRKTIRFGYLPQEPEFSPGNTVIDEAELAFQELHELAHRLRDAEHQMAHEQGDELDRTLKRYQTLVQQFDAAGGHAWRHRVEAILLGVGLPQAMWEQDVATLSGGQRSRLALGKLLVQEPDLLLLDEPTNHLDLEAIQWLEDYLIDFRGAVLIISHDRYLLDRICTRIAWVHDAHVSAYDGNYSDFIQQRELLELTQQRQFQRQQEEVEKTKEFIRRFSAGQRAREAKGREKRLKRFLASDQLVGSVQQQQTIHLSFSTDLRAGDQLLSVRELSKRYDDKQLWSNLMFDVRRGERIGIIGSNGSGKTTLLETLIGLRDADAGKIRWGTNLNIGYYDQDFGDLDEEKTVLDQVLDTRGEMGIQTVRDMLGAMLFSDDTVEKKIAVLSGGERARVRLAELLLDKPNVLLLDEPTNHLDIASREALEQTLLKFEGSLICVSHDRYFLKRICKRLMILKPPAMEDFPGNYEEWQWKQKHSAAESAKPAATAKPAAPVKPAAPATAAAKKKDNPYLRLFGRLTTEQLEHEIAAAEDGIIDCEMAFADPDTFKDAGRARELQDEYEGLKQRLVQLEQEYFSREA